MNALKDGKHEDALSSGKRALSLDPANTTVKHAVDLLEELLAEVMYHNWCKHTAMIWATEPDSISVQRAQVLAAMMLALKAPRSMINSNLKKQTV